MVKGKAKDLVFCGVEKSRQVGVFFLLLFGHLRDKKGEIFPLLGFGFQQQKTERKNREGEEKKKRERREEKRETKATNLGLLVSKVFYSDCMVFLAFLMVE